MEKLVAHACLADLAHKVVNAFDPELEFFLVVPLNGGFVNFGPFFNHL
jgi:hypothetical protein